MEDELWMRKIKERLDDYSEPLPVSGWERLEKDLSVSKPPVAGKRRIIPFRRWAVAAAAALLVAVSSVSVWLLQSPVGEEMRNTAAPTLAAVPDKLPEQQTPSVRTEITEPDYRAQKQESPADRNRRSLLAQQLNTADETEREAVVQSLNAEPEVQTGNVQERTAESAQANQEAAEEVVAEEERTEKVERRRPSGRDKLHLPVGGTKREQSRGWSVGLAVGNTGGLISGSSMDESGLLQNGQSFGVSGGRVDLTTMSDGIMEVPDGQELVFKDGIPYLQRSSGQVVDIDHKQPLSFGFSVRKGLARGFSVETGLTYTYLASDVKFAGSSETVSQKLHYLGIPLRANWNFVDKKSFIMYVSAGGAMEKCVYGKIGSKNETVKPLQFSVMGAVGAQYNISSRVGIYVEPGVSYFFDDGSDIETIRKENPCNFTLQGGVRLTY